MVNQEPVSDMKPSDSDTNTELPLSRPGGGSQDSIDSLEEILMDIRVSTYKVTNDETLDKLLYDAQERIEAWHNTQLKASIPEKKQAFGEQMHPGKYDMENQWKFGYNQAIDDVQARLEKQGHE